MKTIRKWFENKKPAIVKILEKWVFKLSNVKIRADKYSSLSPSSIDNTASPYFEALKWAFENRKEKDIKNLAITGPYGSGKSTVLKSFQEYYNNPKAKYLNISLASFGNEMEENDNKDKPSSELILRKIETSILQQIFFYEDDKLIPDSRFKKIRHRKKSWQLRIAVISILFISATCNIIFPNFYDDIYLKGNFSNFTSSLLHYVSYLVVFVIGSYIIYKSSRILRSISIEKFKVKNVKFTVGDKENKSILNHHLDEIIYFFSVRPYNVVIIEDLDRFQQTEIFIKLREINNLLNSSKSLNGKHVLFIYAVRDDMFKDVERTKFFDFVIPVIPVINSFNSGEKIRRWRDDSGIILNEDFIDGISFYIDDMRLLQNICNEYNIYSALQGQNLENEKLFTIITYKNKYPKDFVQLNNNGGELYHALGSKANIIHDEIKKIDDKIANLASTIDRLRDREEISIQNLRKLYVAHAYEALDGIFTFIYNDQNISLNLMVTDTFWEAFVSNQMQYKFMRYRHHIQFTQPLAFQFSDLELKVNKEATYDVLSSDITDRANGTINDLSNSIANLEKEKDRLTRMPLYEVLKRGGSLNHAEDTAVDRSFLEFILNSNYIGEDYSYYTSLFHAESLTRVDHQFILNINQNKKPDFKLILTRTENIIKKISDYSFSTPSVLNTTLLDALLKDNISQSAKCKVLFDQLSNGSKDSLGFIKEYRTFGKEISTFISLLVGANINLWHQIEDSKQWTDQDKEMLFINILDYASTTAFTNSPNATTLSKYAEDKAQLINRSSIKNNALAVIKTLNIKFTKIDFTRIDSEIGDFIYNNHQYTITFDNIKAILDKYSNGELKVRLANYTSILESKCDPLIQYINVNILYYIKNVYLKREGLAQDEEKDILKLLKHPDIRENIENSILDIWSGKLSNVREVEINTTPSYLFKNNKVVAIWNNIFRGFNENLELEDLTSYLNIEENYKSLSTHKITSTQITEFPKVIESIFDLDGLSNECISHLVKSFKGYSFENDLEELNGNWISELIKSDMIPITFLSFSTLSERADSSHVKFYLQYPDKLDKFEEELYFDEDDIILILKSDKIDPIKKANLIKSLSDSSAITSSTSRSNIIAELMLSLSPILTNKSLANDIMLESGISDEVKIKLFDHFIYKIDQISIDEFLETLGDPYFDIVTEKTMAKLPITENNTILLKKLKSLDYISSFTTKKSTFGKEKYRVNLFRK